MTALLTNQLSLLDDLLGETLTDRLADRRRLPRAGAERLLVELIRHGLDVRALRPAALLIAELDDRAAARRLAEGTQPA